MCRLCSQREASEQSNKEGCRADQPAVESYVEEQERCSEDFFQNEVKEKVTIRKCEFAYFFPSDRQGLFLSPHHIRGFFFFFFCIAWVLTRGWPHQLAIYFSIIFHIFLLQGMTPRLTLHQIPIAFLTLQVSSSLSNPPSPLPKCFFLKSLLNFSLASAMLEQCLPLY